MIEVQQFNSISGKYRRAFIAEAVKNLSRESSCCTSTDFNRQKKTKRVWDIRVILEAQLVSCNQSMSVVTRHLLPRCTCCCGTFVYTFESTSLLLQPHSQFVRGENVVKIPVHY